MEYKKEKTGHIYKTQTGKFTSLSIMFKAGTLYEPDDKKGLSHLMEHLICKTVQEYDERFINDCIEFNAETSIDYVEFYFRGLSSKLTPAFKQELVKKLLGGLDITEKILATEKDIVKQEILDSYEDPFEGNILNCYYKYYNLVDPGGFIETVESVTLDDVKKTYNTVFTKPLRIVEVGKEKSDFSWVNYEENLPEPVEIRFKKSKREILPVNNGDKSNVFVLPKKIAKKSHYKYLAIGLNMLLDGFNSPFMQEIREKRGLSYYIHGEILQVVDKSLIWFYASTDKKNTALLKDVFKDLCINVRQYLTKERFDMVMDHIVTCREIKKIFLWKNTAKYTEYEHAHLPTNLSKIDYERLVGVVEKYLYNTIIVDF